MRVSWPENTKLVEAKKSNEMAAGVHRETLFNQRQIFGRNASERFLVVSVHVATFPREEFRINDFETLYRDSAGPSKRGEPMNFR